MAIRSNALPNTISVCLASYNGEKYIRQQIDSILPQLKHGDELLVSDDGSSDKTLLILNAYGKRLSIIASSRAGGVVKNFERVISAASGSFIVLCDQDDIWLDGRVELIRGRLNHVTLLMMNGEVVDDELKPSGFDVYNFVSFRPGFFRNFISTTYVGCCMAFRCELKNLVLPFPENIQWHDWYIALAAELFYDVECSPVKTILFRRHQGNASATGQISKASFSSKLRNRYWMGRAITIFCLRVLRLRFQGRV